MKRTIEKAYANAIKKLMQGLQDELKNLDSPFLIASTIKSLARQPTFIKKAEALAKGMITQLFPTTQSLGDKLLIKVAKVR